MWATWRVRSGILDNSDTTGSSDWGLPRDAPLGEPVVRS